MSVSETTTDRQAIRTWSEDCHGHSAVVCPIGDDGQSGGVLRMNGKERRSSKVVERTS